MEWTPKKGDPATKWAKTHTGAVLTVTTLDNGWSCTRNGARKFFSDKAAAKRWLGLPLKQTNVRPAPPRPEDICWLADAGYLPRNPYAAVRERALQTEVDYLVARLPAETKAPYLRPFPFHVARVPSDAPKRDVDWYASRDYKEYCESIGAAPAAPEARRVFGRPMPVQVKDRPARRRSQAVDRPTVSP